MNEFWLHATSRRRQRIWYRKNKAYVFFVAGTIAGFTIGCFLFNRPEPKFISPCPENGCFELIPTATPVKIEPTTSPNQSGRVINGKASYYSVSGCLGCSDNRTMANGEVLDDTRATVAYNHLPLNTPVKITNVKNSKTITVPVTDRGGFEKYGKIADLSLATKNALQCGDVCEITILPAK